MPTKLRCIAYHDRTGVRCTRTSKRHPLCRAHRRGLNLLMVMFDEERAGCIAAEPWATIEEFKRRRALRMSLSDAAPLEAGLLSHAARSLLADARRPEPIEEVEPCLASPRSSLDPRFFTSDPEEDDDA